MNRLFVVNKPIFVGSNRYMGYLKRKYGTKKIGFSGTLDPFATGCLIVATGQYTKLFRYLAKTPKIYHATLWLGAHSPSLDIENVTHIETIAPRSETEICEALSSLKGDITYRPPSYSAKKIDGKRAYTLVREGKTVETKPITSTIYDIRLLHYTHPFIHFEATVGEGTYIRSLGAMIAEKLGLFATLSSLHRVSEGKFRYENEKALNPFDYLAIPKNRYFGNHAYLEQGKRLRIDYFETKRDGTYLVETENFYSIVEIVDGSVTYKLNRLEKPDTK